MTGKRKMLYLGVIGVGLGALILDRLLSGRAPASAAGAVARAAAPTPAVTPATIPAVTIERLLVSVLPFPQVLTVDGFQTKPRDPFDMTAAVLNALAPPLEAAPETVAQVEAQAIESYTERHVLSGVMFLGDERIAIVDGMSVELGSQVDECIVTEIAARSISFECPGGAVQLHLEPPISNPSSSQPSGSPP